MSISLYDISVPVFLRSLSNLVSLLNKAEYQANLKGYPSSLLLQSRLYPDMYELSRQVIRAADLASQGIAQLSQHPFTPYTGEIITLPQHIAYVNNAISYLLSVPPRTLVVNPEQKFPLPPSGEEQYGATGYTLFYLLPNFYFHITTGYNILRHNGIEIGKQDYLGKQYPLSIQGQN